MGRIEHKLLVGMPLPNRPKTFTRFPLNPTIPQKVTNVSIYHKGSESPNVATVGAPTHDRSRCAEHGRMGCARPTGGSHARTARAPAQRAEGAERRPRCLAKEGKQKKVSRTTRPTHAYKGRSP